MLRLRCGNDSALSVLEQCLVCPWQVATDQMIQLLSDEDTLRRVRGAPQASLQTLAAMLALTSAQKPSALQEAAPQETLHDGTRDSLRYVSAHLHVEHTLRQRRWLLME